MQDFHECLLLRFVVLCSSDVLNMQLHVISLRRSVKRREKFIERNKGLKLGYQFVDGIDGVEQWPALLSSKKVRRARSDGWSKGAIGAALSHQFLWRKCINDDQAMCVIEDDTILASKFLGDFLSIWSQNLEEIDFLLLGWNLDSVLKAEFLPGISFVSLFEPPFPSIKQIKEIVNSVSTRSLIPLEKALGLPGYIVTPSGARKLLDGISEFIAEPLIVGRGIPQVLSMTLDAQMNRIYSSMNSLVVIPPLLLAENDISTSLTSHKLLPRDFG